MPTPPARGRGSCSTATCSGHGRQGKQTETDLQVKGNFAKEAKGKIDEMDSGISSGNITAGQAQSEILQWAVDFIITKYIKVVSRKTKKSFTGKVCSIFDRMFNLMRKNVSDPNMQQEIYEAMKTQLKVSYDKCVCVKEFTGQVGQVENSQTFEILTGGGTGAGQIQGTSTGTKKPESEKTDESKLEGLTEQQRLHRIYLDIIS